IIVEAYKRIRRQLPVPVHPPHRDPLVDGVFVPGRPTVARPPALRADDDGIVAKVLQPLREPERVALGSAWVVGGEEMGGEQDSHADRPSQSPCAALAPPSAIVFRLGGPHLEAN